MEHLIMHSVDGVTQNVERIAALFPNCVTERKDENGSVERAIDFDMLRQELSRDNYHITGVPFYNKGNENEFKKELETMLGL